MLTAQMLHVSYKTQKECRVRDRRRNIRKAFILWSLRKNWKKMNGKRQLALSADYGQNCTDSGQLERILVNSSVTGVIS
jgi:hypothetical protein